MRPWTIVAACALLYLSCALAVAQQPTAKITGPKESPVGDLVVLDASQSQGLGYLWLLVNSDKSFLPVDGGLKCVFSSGSPGKYIFVLVVSGTNNNQGPAAATATHELLVVGPDPIPPVPIPPDPTPPVPPDPTPPTPRQLGWITVMEESGNRTVEQGRLYQSDQLWTWLAKRRVSFRVLDQDLKDEADQPSVVAQAFLKARGETPLPVLFLDSDHNPSNGVVWVGSVPADVDGLMKLLKQHGGE